MKSGEGEDGERTVVGGRTALHGAHLRTLDALFRHPTAHNLEWMDVIALFEKIGTVHQKPNAKFALDLAGERYVLRKAHTKDLTSSEVVDVRHFLQRAGWSPGAPSQAVARGASERSLSWWSWIIMARRYFASNQDPMTLYRTKSRPTTRIISCITLPTKINRVKRASAPQRTRASMGGSAMLSLREAESLWWDMEKERATRRGTWSNTCACTTAKRISASCKRLRRTCPR
jgi:hypothetical protein